MSKESSNQNNSQSQSTPTSKPQHCRPKVNPSKTINYRQDSADKGHKKE